MLLKRMEQLVRPCSFLLKKNNKGKNDILKIQHCFLYPGKPNKEFNLRHDWNSLISDDESLLVKHYSKEFFPKADDYVSNSNDD